MHLQFPQAANKMYLRTYLRMILRTKVPLALFVYALFLLKPQSFSTGFRRHVKPAEIHVDQSPRNLSIEFVTFAFTENAGGRWTSKQASRAIRLMYSSLVKSQSQFPRLHVYTDTPEVIPNATTMETPVDIITHICKPNDFPRNPYTGTDEWKSLSRSKLDVVEQLIISRKNSIIWIDLDTIVFVDLGISATTSWVVGYQNGSCEGAKTCSWEHVQNGGAVVRQIEPKYDTLGDLWSVNLQAINAFKRYEKTHIESGLELPRYDIQGFFHHHAAR